MITVTPEFIFRGQMAHSRENLNIAYAASGFRPHCEGPMMAAYGSIYSGLTGICGCGWYLPTAYLKSGKHHEQPEVSERTTKPGSTIGIGSLRPKGSSKEWHLTNSGKPSSKSERFGQFLIR